jgi:DNA-directed RNA polymerase specialized sigma24 family protein
MSRDTLSEFPTTAATFLTMCLDRASDGDTAEACRHVMLRYSAPLVAYAASSRLSRVDEPEELVHGFFAEKLATRGFLDRWRASGMPLRRWMLNGLVFHARGLVRDRAREDSRRLPASHLEHEPADSSETERLFERAWALALVEAACRFVHAELAAEGRESAYDAFHRHHFHGVALATLAAERGTPIGTISTELRHATRRLRRTAESMLRDEIGSADPLEIERELERVRTLTGWSP